MQGQHTMREQNAMERAGAGARIRAFAVDYVVIAAYIVVLAGGASLLMSGPLGDEWPSLFGDPVRADAMAFALLVLPVILYFTVAEASGRRATPGKRRLGLEVVSTRGGRAPFALTFRRNVLRFLPWQMAHTAMFHIPGFPMDVQAIPGWCVATLTASWLLVAVYLLGLTRVGGRRPLYDRFAGTVVVVRGSERGVGS